MEPKAQSGTRWSFALACFALASCVLAQDLPDLDIHRQVLLDPSDESIEAYLATLPRDGRYYIVEGDLLMTEDEVRRYLVAEQATLREVQTSDAKITPELVLNLANGDPDYWKDPAERHLTYAIDVASFPANRRQYHVPLIREGLLTAGREWSELCDSCGIRFEHLTEHDAAPDHRNVTFIVRYRGPGGGTLASAFFPHQANGRRYLNIYQNFFSSAYDKTGVLRHELGHVLGYRHEHIRDIAGCRRENERWIPLTPYDPKSVMHYFCGGGGSRSFLLSDTDEIAHGKLYGEGISP